MMIRTIPRSNACWSSQEDCRSGSVDPPADFVLCQALFIIVTGNLCKQFITIKHIDVLRNRLGAKKRPV